MAGVQVLPPYQVFYDRDGQPLEDGYLFIGPQNQNPLAVQIPVYWDAGQTIPAAQPIRTINGYPSRNGTPANLFSSEPVYAIAVQDKNGTFVYSKLDSTSATDFQAALANDTDFALGVSLIGGAQRILDYADQIRQLPDDGNKSVQTKRYHDDLAGGGGFYDQDPNDNSSVDDGFLVFVSITGMRYKLRLDKDYLDVRQAGARADDALFTGTNSYFAIQKVLDAAVANKIGRVKAIGAYKIEDTLIMDTNVFTQGIILEGDGSTSQIRQVTAGKDVLWFSTTQFLRNSGLKDISLWSEVTAGHGVNIKFGCTLCKFENVNVTILNPGKSTYTGVWSSLGVGDPHGVFDTIWEGGDLYMAPTSTVFGMDFVTNGTAFNENNFKNMRVHQAKSVAFFRCTNIDNATYLVNNTWEHINFEVCAGGGIVITNGRGSVIKECSFWDTPTYTNHLIHFASNSGLEGLCNTIINVQRNGDTLAAGIRDIWTEYANFTTIINSFNTADINPSYDWNNKQVTIIGPTLPVGSELNFGVRSYINLTTHPNHAAVINGVAGTLQGGYNVSVSKLGTGQYRLTFPLAKADTNYRVFAMSATGTAALAPQYVKATGFVDIVTLDSASTLYDPTSLDVTIFG